MSGGFLGLNVRVGDVYKVTVRLPSNGSEIQYRIQSDAEIYERVMAENFLESAEFPHAKVIDHTASMKPLCPKPAIESGIVSVLAAAGAMKRARRR